MHEKIVLIGAGSAVFTRGLVADLLSQEREIELALVDTDPEALEVANRLSRKMVEARNAHVNMCASVNRRDVLPGATAIICTIGVGGRRAWEQDVFIPRKYGIYQPVGDTVMPGGTSRALRMVPAMVEIAKDVLDLAPQALFFNYGNPMACVCRGVRKATGADIVGLCHGVNMVGNYLAGALEAPQETLTYSAVGMNHLTWFTEVHADGRDAMPRLREIAEHRSPEESEAFSWELFRLFGAFPAVLDRHVCEFFPQFFRTGSYYGQTLGIDAFSFEDTIARGDKRYRQMQEDAFSPAPLPEGYFRRASGEHEQVMEIIESIRHDRAKVYSANLPNTGQVPNLPPESIIEGPAITDATGLRAITQPPLSPGIAGTLATRLQWVETTVDAALSGSREKFVQALVLDGSVDSPETAGKLADELLAAQAPYLPWFKVQN